MQDARGGGPGRFDGKAAYYAQHEKNGEGCTPDQYEGAEGGIRQTSHTIFRMRDGTPQPFFVDMKEHYACMVDSTGDDTRPPDKSASVSQYRPAARRRIHIDSYTTAPIGWERELGGMVVWSRPSDMSFGLTHKKVEKKIRISRLACIAQKCKVRGVGWQVLFVIVYLTHDPVPYLMRQDDAEGETILQKEGKESYVVVRDARGFLAEILVDNLRGDGRTTNLPFTDVIVPRTDKVAAAMRDEGSVWAVGLCTIGFEELRAEHRRFGHLGRDKLEPTLACRGMQARSEDWKRFETECRLCPLKNTTIPTLTPIPTRHEDAGGPFDIMQIDHWFPNDDEVAGPHKCCMQVIDEWGGLDLDYPLRSRNQSIEGFKEYIDFVESFGGVQFQKEGPKTVAARIHCDDAPEFRGGEFGAFVERRGMRFLDHPSGIKGALGFVEGKNRHTRAELDAFRAEWKHRFKSGIKLPGSEVVWLYKKNKNLAVVTRKQPNRDVWDIIHTHPHYVKPVKKGIVACWGGPEWVPESNESQQQQPYAIPPSSEESSQNDFLPAPPV
uniref:Integrase catalytic domain-containing protein n=1 Tax=Chromera velia CCMP2878 TaxID=1169474 RepID=A0A0G4FVR8_9ALVE|eukprot:Cvel_3766.t1-p1 / transcript=Cvel_3766.t1 / gene=Cvel_3766 / organism=Chromera_velia_CCMP2878 / gene_product=hypothetical protein / transcript_product=hypothetical protein / location=Cvel_scaffold158:7741-9558(-) / protein_length=551 / sequence_SO=supercontig / SO=protein_coding / is_pseudo=false